MSNNLLKVMENTTSKNNNSTPGPSVFILSSRTKNLLLPNKRIKELIADAVGVDYWTIHRWIQNDDSKITQAGAMKVIRDETGLTDDLILTEFIA